MGRRTPALALFGLICAVMLQSAAPRAVGQPQHPAPVDPLEPTASWCIKVLLHGGPHSGPLKVGATYQIKGQSKCARSAEKGVRAMLDQADNVLTTFNAAEDGSYLSPAFRVPSVKPGAHLGIVQTKDGRLFRSVEVVVGAAVLGGSTTRDRTGTLPLTGMQIALLFFLAMIVVATGVIFRRWSAQRRRVRVRPRSIRRRGPLALPPPEIPFIDTSGFVPFRSPRDVRTQPERDVDLTPTRKAERLG